MNINIFAVGGNHTIFLHFGVLPFKNYEPFLVYIKKTLTF